MMNSKKLAILGVGACAAACTGAVLLPALVGAGIVGAGGGAMALGASLETAALLAAAVAAGAGAMYLLQRRKAAQHACPADGSCGCNHKRADALK
jgi:hypothetical protein